MRGVTEKTKKRAPAPANKGPAELPKPFADWFARRGWAPRAHQLALVEKSRTRRSTLLVAPTGAGKTLAGFLPTLIALSGDKRPKSASGLRTLYISPLKALAEDISRNLVTPVSEMGLKISIETRTGDTSVARRSRQRVKPPQILLTTPEQVALMLSGSDAGYVFGDLDTIILDELHALAPSKRGDLLSLGLARLRTFAPDLMSLGLSATVARPSELLSYLVPQSAPDLMRVMGDLVVAPGGADPEIDILEIEAPLPWSGHSARYAIHDIYRAIETHKTTLVFVNTRMQAELVFQELWRINEAALPIALHHGSLDKTRRLKVEAAMAEGKLRAVVATSTLDLGIDWGDVDLVVNVGAPKGASRLMQRIGRANHRLDEPSTALLVPANRFEVLECRAALEAAKAGEQDAVTFRSGALDVLAQHVLGMACHGPFSPDALFEEVRSASPYSSLTRTRFDRVVEFVATGGYALKSYERFAKLRPTDDGRLRLAHPLFIRQYRMNAGTIVEAPMIKVRLVGQRRGKKLGKPGAPRPLMGGKVLGEVEESFIEQLSPGQTFVFGGEIVRFEGMEETEAYVTRAPGVDAMIPSYAGGKFPLSTHLAKRVRAMLADRSRWRDLPTPVAEWLGLQFDYSQLPGADDVLVETFPRRSRHFLVAYPFEGRLAHQTLGMLLTRRLEREGTRPLGFVANDYGLAVWGLGDLSERIANGSLDLAQLFAEDMLGDDLEAWLAESSLMRRTFRTAAVIAGLIERRHPGREKSGRQVTVSTDLVYNVLRRHDPGHILLEAAWEDAATGLLDIARLGQFLARARGRIRHQALDRVSPLAVPILLEIGVEPVGQLAREDLLREAAEDLIAEATRTVEGNGDGREKHDTVARTEARAPRRR
ncbi:ligase-associated DNA damage response DEXH box helicase [Hyphomicrobium sp.]|uniref:ligase-associated DNA damage response DEXH box helicase n=1 Tax=Hyphomicrobium sp. TaxID=82 RepID=UPI002E37D610|nr:ligase-associated DNA damage response DEXH box helicase [Hyphomicrobium sp.]HEX2839772.1 ligase-associated DNA damage response DEXH box helicase [Hyphomicrobium sp.]